MRRDNKHRNVLYRYTRPQTACAEARLGQTACVWAPTRPTTLDVRTYTYSVRSVPTEQHQQTLLIHDVFLLLVGSTKSSFSSSSTSSRCLCSSRQGELTACVRVGSLEERRWESAPSIRAQLLIYYTKLLLRGQRSRLSSPQPAGKLGLQAVQAQATKLQSRALPHLIGNGDRGVTLVPGGCEPLCAARHQVSAAGHPASQPPCSLLRQGYTGGGMGGGTHQGCSSHWKASSLEWPP